MAMTQFQVPPPLPVGVDYGEAAFVNSGRPRWSAAAIGGFVLSLLGFVGVTALLGLIFGIIGIAATRGGRRRGAGLAIAAVPISLVTGTIAVFLLRAVIMVTQMMEMPEKLEQVFVSTEASAPGAASALREIGSRSLNEAVEQAALEGWLGTIGRTHGKLVSVALGTQKPVEFTAEGGFAMNLKGKFVNGPADIRIVFGRDSLRPVRIDDIEVAGSSPRLSCSVTPTGRPNRERRPQSVADGDAAGRG